MSRSPTASLQQMRTWIMECLDLKLDEGTLDLFCAKYRYTGTLLCHHDELKLNVSHDTILKILMACILYLTKDDRSDVDGGMLKLFDTEKKGNPDKIVQNLFPEGNSFPLFKVSSVSVLTVSEVLITERLVSRQGPCAQAKREPPPSLVAISPQELEEAEFYRWMNPSYLDPETQFEQSSEISLSG